MQITGLTLTPYRLLQNSASNPLIWDHISQEGLSMLYFDLLFLGKQSILYF